MTEIKLSTACCGGEQLVLSHWGESVACEMQCAVFLPQQAKQQDVQAVIYLSGLTCSWENATTKAGAQKAANALGLALIFPDTSPRGEQVPDDEAYDLGQGAGFYLNATQAPWNAHYAMQDYILKDLVGLIAEAKLPIKADAFGLMGHSMGGHGALTLALKNPSLFPSVSAFAPIVNPCDVPWGQKAFKAYLGEDQAAWKQYDACHLVQEHGYAGEILIDQGLADPFLNTQLQADVFATACKKANVSLRLNQHADYDHSYYFIASFIDQHLEFHSSKTRGL